MQKKPDRTQFQYSPGLLLGKHPTSRPPKKVDTSLYLLSSVRTRLDPLKRTRTNTKTILKPKEYPRHRRLRIRRIYRSECFGTYPAAKYHDRCRETQESPISQTERGACRNRK